MIRIISVLIVVAAVAQPVSAQQPHAFVGGAVALVIQPHSDEEPVGGTTHGASVLFGVQVSSRVAIEVEPSFSGKHSQDYTYRPFASGGTATVVATRQDTFFPVQARIKAGVLEPVFGVGIVRSTIARHATFPNGTIYFDDGRSDHYVAAVGGLDAALRLASHLYLVPTFRVRVGRRESEPEDDRLGEQTRTGLFNFRYGVGARVAF